MTEFDPEAFTRESARTWTDAAPRYDKLSAALFAKVTEEFVDFADIRKGMSVLELACGPGIASRAAARRAGEKGRVLATDLSAGMIELAAARPPEKRAAPIEWKVMDAQKLELPDGSFDAVLSQLGLMLFARPEAALAEMRRVAAPGAPVACLVQGKRHKMLFTALVFDAMMRRAPRLKAPPGAPTLYSFGPEGVLEKAFAQAGLREMTVRRFEGTFRFSSPEEYWTVMTEGAGRTGEMLRSLEPSVQAKVRGDVLRIAGKFKTGRSVAIPYEFAACRGRAPSYR